MNFVIQLEAFLRAIRNKKCASMNKLTLQRVLLFLIIVVHLPFNFTIQYTDGT
jgi:hypothetical protein